MHKFLTFTGMFFIVAGILALLIAAFFLYASKHTLDASADVYARQRMIALITLLIGLGLILLGGILIFVARR